MSDLTQVPDDDLRVEWRRQERIRDEQYRAAWAELRAELASEAGLADLTDEQLDSIVTAVDNYREKL